MSRRKISQREAHRLQRELRDWRGWAETLQASNYAGVRVVVVGLLAEEKARIETALLFRSVLIARLDSSNNLRVVAAAPAPPDR